MHCTCSALVVPEHHFAVVGFPTDTTFSHMLDIVNMSGQKHNNQIVSLFILVLLQLVLVFAPLYLILLSYTVVYDLWSSIHLSYASTCLLVTMLVSSIIVRSHIIPGGISLSFKPWMNCFLIACLILCNCILPLLFGAFIFFPLHFHFFYSICSIGGILSFHYVVGRIWYLKCHISHQVYYIILVLLVWGSPSIIGLFCLALFVFLPIEPQSNVGCLNMGLPFCAPMLVGWLLTPELPSLTFTSIACTPVFAASSATCMMACVISAWSTTILYFFAYFTWNCLVWVCLSSVLLMSA